MSSSSSSSAMFKEEETAEVSLPGQNDNGGENEEEDVSHVNVVLDYFRRLLAAAQQLTWLEDNDAMMDVDVDVDLDIDKHKHEEEEEDCLGQNDGAYYVDRLARMLLEASQLSTLTASTEHLPRLTVFEESWEDSNDDNNNSKDDYSKNNNDNDSRFYHYHLWRRRLDYLRLLLRAMAPIQMDVAAHVCSILLPVLQQQQQQQQQVATTTTMLPRDDMAMAAFVLFSVWLPVAPQIAPLVSDLLALESFPCPLNVDAANHAAYSPSGQQRLLLVEAAHNLCQFYCKRREQPVLLTWWDWSPIFGWFLDNNNGNRNSCNQKEQEDQDCAMMQEEEGKEEEEEGNDLSSSSICLSVNDDEEQQAKAIRWHAVRVAARVMNLSAAAKARYYERFHVEQEQVPWIIHPWIIDNEETVTQALHFRGHTRIWGDYDDDHFLYPIAEQIRAFVPLHPYLVEIGDGLVFVKHHAVRNVSLLTLTAAAEGAARSSWASTESSKKKNSRPCRLVRTSTTAYNLSLIGSAMCIDPNPPPILICGPQGSGKSCLVRELARLLFARSADSSHDGAATTHHHHHDQLLEIHVDEETDTKSLVGTYTASDIPGEFEWRPGALTQAVRTGKWVLMEDVDGIPLEIQASLVQLLEERLLPLGNGKVEQCHPNFRLFGTLSTLSDSSSSARSHGSSLPHSTTGGKRVLNPSFWTMVHVQPLPFSELKEIAMGLHPCIPESVVDSTLELFRAIDQSGRMMAQDNEVPVGDNKSTTRPPSNSSLWIGRAPSVRDLFKVFSRIRNGVIFEKRDAAYVTESQRTLCMAESIDVFVSASPDENVRREFIRTIAAPIWGITSDLALRYVETRNPTILLHETCTEIGRAKIPVSSSENGSSSQTRVQSETFARTDYALRLMEAIGVCIQENEPTLLTGETGTGKTTLLQQIAKVAGRELVVQNLSLQTDSTDLLGGYRPLEMRFVARKIYEDFVELFVSTFSRKQNAEFMRFASTALQKSQWKRLSQCFRRAAKLGLSKVKERQKSDQESVSLVPAWRRFSNVADRFEQQRLACDTGMAFVFTEGALVDAIRKGKWILLDEINLASSETLQRLCGLLDDSTGSLTLTERGDAGAIERHPDFRLFAAMNPATDAGKKELGPNIRSRFTELYVNELLDPVELRAIASRYLSGVLPASVRPPEHTDTVIVLVDIYLSCRELAEKVLVDGSGQKPRYTLRTLTRALTAARTMVMEQKIPLKRALYEGFELAFQGPLDLSSLKVLRKTFRVILGENSNLDQLDHPGRRPGNHRTDSETYVLVKPFWIKSGPLDPIDWSEASERNTERFVLTPTTAINLRRLARAVASGPWPVLLEGPTSSGKTSLVEYLAARCGHRVIRINNHEHTDIQEYVGGFAADSNGFLSFQDGLLVRALRQGDWIILDELNLAPTEVLEALNRLLDDNRELYLPEINETVKPHPDFRLFATQNPSGAYGGRKPLSRAFRNRFVELHVGEIPSSELVMILEQRCRCPPSHAKLLVSVMKTLQQRRRRSGIFLGKDGFITPRDLLRWAERRVSTKLDLAREGYMLLAERLRTSEEKKCVQDVIESHLKLKIDIECLYYGESSKGRRLVNKALTATGGDDDEALSSIAPTRALLRLITLASRCIEQKEPVLLVGDTGCGKTTVVQLLSQMLDSRLHVVNCHATTETADFLGGLRPVRGRYLLARIMAMKIGEFVYRWPNKHSLASVSMPPFLQACLAQDAPHTVDGLDEELEPREPPDVALSSDAVTQMMEFIRTLWREWPKNPNDYVNESGERTTKRQKIEGIVASDVDTGEASAVSFQAMADLFGEIENLYHRYNALFEWSDGPLVQAMKAGDHILLDEMSLAEDAVLERINSVLEPSRTLVLAEKGVVAETESRIIRAMNGFQLFATMNPGGDFGKRELSPALRSRFTEIWVPSISDPSDIGLVLERSLASLGSISSVVKERMMEYVQWFNMSICEDVSNPSPELSLSLRDILTWAKFVVTALKPSIGLNIWEAYWHGVCLMHLDGLGLGSGLSLESAAEVKARAESFLSRQMYPDEDSCRKYGKNDAFQVKAGRFGSNPFWIPTGLHPLSNLDFNFEAPTTASNLLRILRAMQLSKPILLEGSPGVGKTSLVSALAVASGHRIIRINLSEQTDLSDLIGTDLPVSTNEEGEPSQAGFRWCDGVLLTAIQAGDWVLLDELNLASQSVLEGLNSCLDHRSSIFIPELGKTVTCPPSFRVFAAQNPLAQGGGRKGLPKSFLNRFTKVYVEALSDEDLQSIVASKFPRMDALLTTRMIGFNSQIHRDTTETRLIGQAGSPWEFNLRDVFRWCELVSTELDGLSAVRSCSRFARDLYIQRFRTSEDREAVAALYSSVFGNDICRLTPPVIRVTKLSLQIGGVSLPRRNGNSAMRYEPNAKEPSLFLSSHHEPLEAVSRCVAMNWPCLIVGRSAVAKRSLISGLAELSGAKLTEITLSPSSDVSELIGYFEQADALDQYRAVFQSLKSVAVDYIVAGGTENVNRVSHLAFWAIDAADSSEQKVMEVAMELASLLSQISPPKLGEQYESDIALMQNRLHMIRSSVDRSGGVAKGLFVWKDGALVEAMMKGHWLHLTNVNLCPATVLDRLNPVLEPGGSLLLAECGMEGDETTGLRHRRIKCHQNFRIFLSMNADSGEVSRAMRNRCVEISLLDRHMPQRKHVDEFDTVWRSGIRSSTLTSRLMLLRKIGRVQRLGSNDGWNDSLAYLVASLALRGVSPKNIFSRPLQFLGNEQLLVDKARDVTKNIDGDNFGGGFPCPSPRDNWTLSPQFAHMLWEARLIRSFASPGKTSPGLRKLLPFELLDAERSRVPAGICMKYERLCSSFDVDGDVGPFKDHLLLLFLSRASSLDLEMRAAFVEGIIVNSNRKINFLAGNIKKLLKSKDDSYSTGESTGEKNESLICQLEELSPNVQLKCFLFRRLRQQARELRWLESMQNTAKELPTHQHSCRLSVLDASFLVADGRIDRGTIRCPVTPIVYPFFLAFDELTEILLEAFGYQEKDTSYITSAMCRRDALWIVLCDIEFLFQPMDLETEFIVQWTWFRKSLELLEGIISTHSFESLKVQWRKVCALVDTIDRAVFGSSSSGPRPFGVSLLKPASRPLVPRTVDDWVTVIAIRKLDKSFSLDDYFASNLSQVRLADLIGARHPVMFVTSKLKRELLAALCTIYIASNEGASWRKQVSFPNVEKEMHSVLRCQFNEAEQTFSGQLDILSIDTPINMVEKTMGIHELESILSKSIVRDVTFGEVSTMLLEKFSRIQLAPIFEYWCEAIEWRCIRELCGYLMRTHGSSESLEPVSMKLLLEKLIRVALDHTLWTMSDLLPYQILLWALESSNISIEPLISSLLPSMCSNALRRTWSGSADRSKRISRELEVPAYETSQRGKNAILSPSRATGQHVPSAALFALIGNEFRLKRDSRISFATLENFRARGKQSRQLVRLFLSNPLKDDSYSSGPSEINILLSDVLRAMRSSLPDTAREELISVLMRPTTLCSFDDTRLTRLAEMCDNQLFHQLFEPVVRPLFGCLRSLWSEPSNATTKKSSRDYSLARIYLGLLRFHLYVPDSPIDPGRRPLAKRNLINRRLSDLRLELSAIRTESGVVHGDFSPATPLVGRLLDESERLLDKRTKQETKVIQRPADSPPFIELHRDAKEFGRRFVNLQTFLPLLELLDSSNASDLQADIRRQVDQWQMTSETFCSRLLLRFALYEDVVLPIVDAVGNIKAGMSMLADLHAKETSMERSRTKLICLCSDFPIKDNINAAELMFLSAQSIGIGTKDDLLRGRAIGLATLSRLVISQRLAGFNSTLLSLWFMATDQIVDAISMQEGSLNCEGTDGGADVSGFLDQFPDHRQDFRTLLQDESAEDSFEDTDSADGETSTCPSSKDTPLLSDEHVELLCDLHCDFFSVDDNRSTDSARMRAFRLSYGAACELFYSCDTLLVPDGECSYSSHAVALSLCTVMEKSMPSSLHSSQAVSSDQFDFHTDPYPDETSKAAAPLEQLMARVNELLTAFPDNSVLITLAKVAERVRKFDLFFVSLAKAMVGLEVILKHAQDWEQHASDRVRIGKALTAVSRLVARWRKLELESWSGLLRSREKLFEKRARRHWARIHHMLRPCEAKCAERTEEMISGAAHTAPRWIWKGCAENGQRISSVSLGSFEEMKEVVKVLDTFMLSAPLGEFSSRLSILGVFAEQVYQEHVCFNKGHERMLLSRSLASLWQYYKQFLPALTGRLVELRQPFEKKLAEEAKLAKWDEQTYYALAESSERNHQRLMRVLREYDEVLEQSVSVLLEAELSRGIRGGDDFSSADTSKEATSSVPSLGTLFPLRRLKLHSSVKLQESESDPKGNIGRPWGDAVAIGAEPDCFAARIHRFATKMVSMHKRMKSDPNCVAGAGASLATELCDAIFNRIETLRSDNATRSMKERSLFDLMKELKRQGYASTKWSTPVQLKRMSEVFQLPSPKAFASDINILASTLLEESDSYYQRCLAELNRFRGEVAVIGSRYLTRPQLDMMLNFSENGLLMLLQQRCVVSAIMSERSSLWLNVAALSSEESDLPAGQHLLVDHVQVFQRDYASAIENVKQLSLMLKVIQPLLMGEDKVERARDAMRVLDKLLTEAACFNRMKSCLVTRQLLDTIDRDREYLKALASHLRSCQKTCSGVLPEDAIQCSLEEVRKAVVSASSCLTAIRRIPSEDDQLRLPLFVECLSKAVEAALLSIQTLTKEDSDKPVESCSIWSYHRSFLSSWTAAELAKMNRGFEAVAAQVKAIDGSHSIEEKTRVSCMRLTSDLAVLYSNALRVIDELLQESLSFHREVAKLQYILIRLFRVLVSKGFCSDSIEEGNDCTEGDASGMTFGDDDEGTGMGEGDGKRDVSDQIENEEQLLGLKNDHNDSDTARGESKQLDEEEAEKGMEMEVDFDGDMFDVPEVDEEKHECSNEEEVDREMGEDGGPNEQVVDEKMWNESDEEDENIDTAEKFENDNSIRGDGAADEMTTRDDEEDKAGNDDEHIRPSGETNERESQDDVEVTDDQKEVVNDDFDDRYEENRGIEVREEDRTQEDEDLVLSDESLDLDDNSSVGSDCDEEDNENQMDNDNDNEEKAQHEEPTLDSSSNNINEQEDEFSEAEEGSGGVSAAVVEDEANVDDPENEGLHDDETPHQAPPDESDQRQGLGVQAQDGNDAIQDAAEEEKNAGQGEDEAEGGSEAAHSDVEHSGEGGSGSGSRQGQSLEQGFDDEHETQQIDDIPNPLSNPREAAKYWHRKLNVVKSQTDDEVMTEANNDEELDHTDQERKGDFEYADQNAKDTTHTLGEAEKEHAVQLKEDEEKIVTESQRKKTEKTEEGETSKRSTDRRRPRPRDESNLGPQADDMEIESSHSTTSTEEIEEEIDDEDPIKLEEDNVNDADLRRNVVVSDVSQLKMDSEMNEEGDLLGQIVEEEQAAGISSSEVSEARAKWSAIQNETHHLSRRLCEKLRLVMEPLVASKLRGDYRTGKRINMKRVIGYIASGYRKDKIWLRRTKPAKRNYRVLVAVDDSESMRSSGAGEMALKAMATLAVGMSHLEIGEIGVASFGDDMHLLHSFEQPFTSESGWNVVRNFRFEQQRTRTALCVESTLMALDTPGNHASMQLVFMISDGRIERDSRTTLRRLIREMTERNILLAMIIVEGEKKKDSILNMKEVSFEKGKPKVKRFIEDYPFPYYIVLDDMQSLPEVLGDALRQWFEILARLQGNTS